MLRITFLICFISILSVFTANAQDELFEKPETTSEKNIWNYFTYDMGNVFGGVGYAYSRPLHWQGNAWA